MLFNAALAIFALAAPALAGMPAPSQAPAKYGCMTDADCGSGYSCGEHNICVKSAPVMVGCSTDADCKGRYPYPAVCKNAICVAAVPKSTVTKVTTWTSTVTTCDNGKCHPCTVCPIYTCIGDACKKCDECEHKKVVPVPTVTIVECAACEGGYTTSTCYPDVTTTITACNTCVTPVTTKKPAPVTTPVCDTCVVSPVVPASPTMPIFYSGAQRTQIAYAGLVGVVAIAAFML
jgi:hypothetical protein